MKKVWKNLIGWILYIALLIGLVYGIPKGLAYVLKTDHPMASITSGSMWPELKKGDLILIKGIDNKEDINISDVIVYSNVKGFTIHRVIEMNEDSLVTKGDANNVKDKPIKYEEVVGKALTINDKPFRIPFLGMIGLFVNKNKL